MNKGRGVMSSLLAVGATGAVVYGISKGIQNGSFQRWQKNISNAKNNSQVKQFMQPIKDITSSQGMQQLATNLQSMNNQSNQQSNSNAQNSNYQSNQQSASNVQNSFNQGIQQLASNLQNSINQDNLQSDSNVQNGTNNEQYQSGGNDSNYQ